MNIQPPAQAIVPEDVIISSRWQRIKQSQESIQEVCEEFYELWAMRCKLYAFFFSKSEGVVDWEATFADEIYSLEDINRSERAHVQYLAKYQQQTLDYFSQDRLFTLLGSSSQTTLDAHHKTITTYINDIVPIHQAFVDAEFRFIREPSLEKLRYAYCILKKVSSVLLEAQHMQGEYVQRLHLAHPIQSLRILDDCIKHALSDFSSRNGNSHLIDDLLRARELLHDFLKGPYPELGPSSSLKVRVDYIRENHLTLLLPGFTRIAIIGTLLETVLAAELQSDMSPHTSEHHPEYMFQMYWSLLSYFTIYADLFFGVPQMIHSAYVTIESSTRSTRGTFDCESLLKKHEF